MRERMYLGGLLAIGARYVVVGVAPLVFARGGMSPAAVGILVGLGFLAQVVGSPFFGRLIDRRSRQAGLTLGALLTGVGGISVFLWPTLWSFIAGELLLGLGSAAFFGAAFALAADLSPTDQRVSALARFGLVVNIGEALAPPLGLALASEPRPYAFGVAALLAFVSLPIWGSLPYVKTEPLPEQHRYSRAPPRAWWWPVALTMCAATSYGVINAYLPPRAVHAKADPALFFLSLFGTQIACRLWVSRQLDRWSRPWRLVTGCGATALGVGLAGVLAGSTSALLIAGTIYGFGSFVLTPSLMAWLTELSGTRTGLGTTAYNAAFAGGSALGAMGLGPIWAGLHLKPDVFSASALLCVLGLLGVLGSRRSGTTRRPVAPSAH